MEDGGCEANQVSAQACSPAAAAGQSRVPLGASQAEAGSVLVRKLWPSSSSAHCVPTGPCPRELS